MIVWGAGFLVLSVVARLLRDDVGGVQAWMNPPPFVVLMVLVAAITLIAFARWGRRGDRDRRAYATGVLYGSGWTILVQGMGPLAGWWPSGTAFAPPVVLQAAVYGTSMMGLVAGVLALYRGLLHRKRKLAVPAMLAFILAMCVATVAGDQLLLDRGALVFANGYSLAWDVIYAVALFGLPPLIYEIARRVRS